MDRVIDLLPPTDDDASRRLLEFAHSLLCGPRIDFVAFNPLLVRLATLASAVHAGLADSQGNLLARTGSAPLPWAAKAELLQDAETTGVAVRSPTGVSWLLAAVRELDVGYHLWLEAEGARGWTEAEARALILVALTLHRRLSRVRQGHGEVVLEQAAAVTRRLAHDFGNILTGIGGFAELARAEVPESSPIAPFLDEIHRAAQQGAQFTLQLRQFGRRSWPTAEPTRLAAALLAEEKRLRERLSGAVRLELDLCADLPAVAVGLEPLRLLLAALLDNAAEANKGGGIVRIKARTVSLGVDECEALLGRALPGSHVEVFVSDEGPGLSAAAAGRLFVEPFFSDKPRRGGIGLGTSYGILYTHKGGLALGPGPKGGTAVRVCLPVALPDKILVVDDDPMILQFVCATLERAGYGVVAARDADEALAFYEAARAEPFRLVLADVMMPRVSGLDLAQKLLRLDASVNVLFMSGQGESHTNRPDARGNGFPLLAKPFRPDGLLMAVRNALAHRLRSSLPALPRRVDEAVLTPSR